MSFFQHLYDTLVPTARNRYRPYALSRKSLSLFSGLLLSAKLLTFFSVDAIPVGQAYASAVTPANIIQLTNASREGYGETDLKENAMLDAAAQAKADDMLAQQYFAHTSPSGKTPWDFISNSGYNYIIAGENLALNFFTAESTEQAWMNSPDHRANILNGNFEDIGVGVAQGQYQGVSAIFVVQEFGTPLPQSYTLQAGGHVTGNATASANQGRSDSIGTPTALDPSNASPAGAAATGTVVVSGSASKSISVPVLNQPAKLVISGDSATVSGTSNEPSVYLAVNGAVQIQVAVSHGAFSSPLQLVPGNNTVTAIASDGHGHVSGTSPGIQFITASVMPQVLSAQVNPLPMDGGSSLAYTLVVHTLPNATNVAASYGEAGVLLQPTNIVGEWQATIPATQLSQTNLVVHAYDMAGNQATSQEISFSSNIRDNFGFQAAPVAHTVPILGKQVPIAALDDIYVGLALIMMVIIGIVLSSRVPVADVGMIAQTAGFIILAILVYTH